MHSTQSAFTQLYSLLISKVNVLLQWEGEMGYFKVFFFLKEGERPLGESFILRKRYENKR